MIMKAHQTVSGVQTDRAQASLRHCYHANQTLRSCVTNRDTTFHPYTSYKLVTTPATAYLPLRLKQTSNVTTVSVGKTLVRPKECRPFNTLITTSSKPFKASNHQGKDRIQLSSKCVKSCPLILEVGKSLSQCKQVSLFTYDTKFDHHESVETSSRRRDIHSLKNFLCYITTTFEEYEIPLILKKNS